MEEASLIHPEEGCIGDIDETIGKRGVPNGETVLDDWPTQSIRDHLRSSKGTFIFLSLIFFGYLFTHLYFLYYKEIFNICSIGALSGLDHCFLLILASLIHKEGKDFFRKLSV
jgi:hypothetical protein